MSYQVTSAEQIRGYLAAFSAKIETLPEADAFKFFDLSCKAIDARKTADIPAEAAEQLDAIKQQVSEIFWRHFGWLA